MFPYSVALKSKYT